MSKTEGMNVVQQMMDEARNNIKASYRTVTENMAPDKRDDFLISEIAGLQVTVKLLELSVDSKIKKAITAFAEQVNQQVERELNEANTDP